MWVNKQVQNVRSTVKRSVHSDAPQLDTVSAMALGRAVGTQDGEGNTKVQGTVRGASSLVGMSADGASSGTIGRGGGTLGRSAAGMAGAYGSFSSFRTFSKNAGSLTHVSWERSSPYMRLVAMAGVCNRARFAYEGDETVDEHGKAKKPSKFKSAPKVLGDASDAALLRFVDGTIPIQELRGFAFPTLFESAY